MDYKKIKSFEDACQVLGMNPEEFGISFPQEAAHHGKALAAHAKLVIITEALNGGWKPNWDDYDEWKYYAWFVMSPSGFRCDDCDNVSTSSLVGSRLCFKSRELAIYAGETFEDLYKDYFLIG